MRAVSPVTGRPTCPCCAAVGELDQHHTDVVDHRQKHFAEVRRLRFLARFELERGELAEAIDQLRHLVAELRRQILLGQRRILDDVMQYGRDDAVAVHLQFGDQARDRQRVVNVRLAAQPGLALMGLLGEQVGAVDVLDLRGVETVLQILTQIGDQIVANHRGGGFRGVCYGGVLVHRMSGEPGARTSASGAVNGAPACLQRIARFEFVPRRRR